jgi:hypothetical protein
VEVYEFLGKYVEDAPRGAAPQPAPGTQPPKAPVATIADLMLAVNQPRGVRGTLTRALEQEPATQQQWDRVRANAALMAEAVRLLETRTPRRGTPGSGWNRSRPWRRPPKASSRRRIVAKLEINPQGSQRRFVVTNLPGQALASPLTPASATPPLRLAINGSRKHLLSLGKVFMLRVAARLVGHTCRPPRPEAL